MTDSTYRIETLAWPLLTTGERGRWHSLRELRPSLQSPFFSPVWCDAVQAARGDVQVAVVRDARGPVLFLPYHRSPLGTLRPVGGPLSDWHGCIGAEAPLPIETVVASLGVGSFAFSGAPDDDPLLAPASSGVSVSYAMDLEDGYEAYVARQRGERPKAFRNLRARRRRLEAEGRVLDVELDDRDPRTLSDTLSLKRAQYRRTRQIDVFGPAWTRDLVERLFHAPTEGPRGRLSSLRIDGELAAAHFGFEADGVLHYWFPVYEERFAAYAPGLILLHELAAAAGDLGIRRIDLGAGAYRFKEEFADLRLPMATGVARSRTLLAGAASGLDAVARGVAGLPLGRAATIPQRALRRLDRMIAFHEAPRRRA